MIHSQLEHRRGYNIVVERYVTSGPGDWALGNSISIGDPVQLLESPNRRLRIRGRAPTFIWLYKLVVDHSL
jgi:hypothetical protein